MSAPRIGKLIAKVLDQTLYFDGEQWSGEGPCPELLNEIKEEWDLHHYSLQDRAEFGLKALLGMSNWVITLVQPDMSDPESGTPPEGWVS